MAVEYITKGNVYDALAQYYHHTTQMQHDALREAIDRVPVTDECQKGDVYFNPVFGDLWIADGNDLYRINDVGCRAEIENVVGFKRVGHIWDI